MKLTILSRSAAISSTRRLVEAARNRGHPVRVLNPVKVEMHLDGTSAKLYYQGKRLPQSDVVIPRIGYSVSNYGLAVVNQYAMCGIPLMNGAQAIAQARNKMRALQLLSAHGIDIPATVMARDASKLREMVKLVGGVPVLVKLLQGSEKPGVMICESLVSLEAALEAILGLGHNLILQQYVRKTGHDIRVLVVGGEAVAAVQRRPKVGRMTPTLIRGARLQAIPLTPAMQQVAVRTAQLVGLEIAAIDLLDVQGALKVFEVNASPALADMEAATGVDIADRIIARAEVLAQAKRPPRALPRTPRKVAGVK